MLAARKVYARSVKVGITLGILMLLVGACGRSGTSPTVGAEPVAPIDTPIHFDLAAIKKRGKIVVLTENNFSTSYYIYKGQPMGYEYELMTEFAQFLGVDLEVKIIDDFNTIFTQLNTGECDMIAANLTITKDRSKKVAFSEPYHITRQVLVQKLPEGYRRMGKRERKKHILNSPLDLIDKDIHVRKNSIILCPLAKFIRRDWWSDKCGFSAGRTWNWRVD